MAEPIVEARCSAPESVLFTMVVCFLPKMTKGQVTDFSVPCNIPVWERKYLHSLSGIQVEGKKQINNYNLGGDEECLKLEREALSGVLENISPKTLHVWNLLCPVGVGLGGAGMGGGRRG